MIGIIFRKHDNVIIRLIPDVQLVTENDIIGSSSSAKGIDLTIVSFCIVDSTTLKKGDTLGAYTDVRHQLPKTAEQIRIEQLEAQLAINNTNNAAFMEFILQTMGVE